MSPSWSRNRRVFEPEDGSKIADLWLLRFGIPNEVFSGVRFYRRAANVWAFCNSDLPKLSYEAVGLRAMDFKEIPWKPTTCALQLFGKYATKNVIHLDADRARSYLAGNSQMLEDGAEPGYVVVSYLGNVLGCGLYSHGRLVSQLPRERRISSD